jgi:L-ascorbate metabolism protein UlaG (beta-lactamase superfamily)
MKIKFLGHACFKITTDKGIRIMTDPFDETVGYKLPTEEVDIVTTSHDHFDHGNTDAPTGNFDVIDKVGSFYVKDIAIKGIHSYHDKEEGKKRGSNIIYIFEVDDIKVCHLGDLGHPLNNDQIDKIGEIDILLIPVGGIYTIDADEAKNVVDLLNPKIVIPMHYKTEDLKFELGSIDDFIRLFEKVEILDKQEIEITKDDIKNEGKRIIVLKYK